MNSEIKSETDQTVQHVADAAPAKSKLPMLIGLLVLGVAAIYGGRAFLDAQVPKGEGDFHREATEVAPGMAGLPSAGGGASTPAGVKPPIAKKAAEEAEAAKANAESEDGESKKEEEKE